MGGTLLRGLVLSFALALLHPTAPAAAADDFAGSREGGAPHAGPPPAARE
jgi:hypothetical protein